MGNSGSKTSGRKKNKQGGEEFLAQILQDILIEMKQSNQHMADLPATLPATLNAEIIALNVATANLTASIVPLNASTAALTLAAGAIPTADAIGTDINNKLRNPGDLRGPIPVHETAV